MKEGILRQMVSKGVTAIKRKVALISGHYGAGTGANGFIDEGDETIVLKKLIDHYLFFNYGVRAIMDKDTMSLRGVVAMMKKLLRIETILPTDLSFSIHFNASQNKKAHGASVYIPTKHTESEKLFADGLLSGVVEILGVSSRGVRMESESHYGKLAILSGFDCMNILLEVCFVTNKEDADKYKANRDYLASFIADYIYKHHILTR